MAMWFSTSLLLLLALLSWNVRCFPARKGWSQSAPNKGSFTNMASSPGLYHSSSQSAPALPPTVNHPAVSFLYDPPTEGVKSHPASPTPGVSSVAWAPVEESMVTYTVSKTSEPTPDIGPPPPFFQAGELSHYEGNAEFGNSEMETEDLSFLPPPLPPAPYPEPVFHAGEFSTYASLSEFGNEERETEEQGFPPLPPYASAPQRVQELSAASTSEGYMHPVPQELNPNDYYRFLTGQFPPGTYSHFQSDYETGGDYWDEHRYERYYYPMAETTAAQTQQLPGDSELWEQYQPQLPQYNTKS